jgi:hypothetical protein
MNKSAELIIDLLIIQKKKKKQTPFFFQNSILHFNIILHAFK